MEELLMCSVCVERYEEGARHPVLLPRCGHSFCRPCITMLASAGCVVCPTCRMDQRVDSVERLPTEFTLLAIIHAQESSKRETCGEHGVKLSFWCKTCGVAACGECLFEDHPTHTHDVIKATKYINHTKEAAREVATKFIECLDDRERVFYKCIFNSVKKISIALREVSVLRKDFEEARDLIKTSNEEVSISSASSLGETAKFLGLKWNIRGESYDTEKHHNKAKKDKGESCAKHSHSKEKCSKGSSPQSKLKEGDSKDQMEIKAAPHKQSQEDTKLPEKVSAESETKDQKASEVASKGVIAETASEQKCKDKAQHNDKTNTGNEAKMSEEEKKKPDMNENKGSKETPKISKAEIKDQKEGEEENKSSSVKVEAKNKKEENKSEELTKENKETIIENEKKENNSNICKDKIETGEKTHDAKSKPGEKTLKEGDAKITKEENKGHGDNKFPAKEGNKTKDVKETNNSQIKDLSPKVKSEAKEQLKEGSKEKTIENEKPDAGPKHGEKGKTTTEKGNPCDEKSLKKDPTKRDDPLIPDQKEPTKEKISEPKATPEEQSRVSKINKDDKKDKSITRLKRWKIKSPQREEHIIETPSTQVNPQTPANNPPNIHSKANPDNAKNPLRDAKEPVSSSPPSHPPPLPGSEGQKIHGMQRAQDQDQHKHTSPESTEPKAPRGVDQMPLQTQVNKVQEDPKSPDKKEKGSEENQTGDPQETKEEDQGGCKGEGCEECDDSEEDSSDESPLVSSKDEGKEFPKSETKLMDCIQVPGFMLGVEAYDGLMATLSWSSQGLLVHSMQLPQLEYDILVKSSVLNSMIPSKSPTVFLELSSEQTILGKVYINLWGHLRRAQNFMTLCLGERGRSYANTRFLQVYNVDSPGERMLGGDYETNTGKGGKGLIDDLEFSSVYSLPMKAGMLTAAGSGQDNTNSLFLICTKSDPSRNFSCPFGVVYEGLKVVSEAVHKVLRQEQIFISDCGVVLIPPVEA